MRGCSCFPLVRFIHIAVFPAYAGMFRRYLSPDHGARRFPRVCGDVPWSARRLVGPYAFSPRMRGCSVIEEDLNTDTKVFPAYAGMFLCRTFKPERKLCFPRVCGDVPIRHPGRNINTKFSPRMRGCSAASVLYDFEYRRFPRVCGDVPCWSPCLLVRTKFSPRMRGCSVFVSRVFKNLLVFPAYAGMFLGGD